MSLKGMGGGLGTSLVGQEETASGKPPGKEEKKKKRKKKRNGLRDGSGARYVAAKSKLHPLGEFVLDLLLSHSPPNY